MLHMAQIQKEKGVPQEAQRILIDFDAQVWESVWGGGRRWLHVLWEKDW